MRSRGQLIVGAAFIIFGLLMVIGIVFEIDAGAICWSVGLILFGVWLIFRPQLMGAGTNLILLGDAHRKGPWLVRNEEFWVGVGDLNFDFTQAEVPAGETVIRSFGFVGDIKVTVPAGVGMAVSAAGFIIDANVLGRKENRILTPLDIETPDYAAAERRVRFDTGYFINSFKVRQG